MKNTLISFLLLFGLVSPFSLAFAQCSPAPRTGGTTIPFGVTDSITPQQAVPQPYLVCDNGSLYYYGNNPDTVYLEGSARLIVGFATNLMVYMRNNSQLKIDTSSLGMKHFNQIVYDPTFTTFVDTANIIVVNGLVSCMGMSYSYAAFPNGNSPCTLPTSIEPALGGEGWRIWPQPAGEWLNIQLPAELQRNATLRLYGLDGKCIYEKANQGMEATISTSGLPKRAYLLQAQNAKTFSTILVAVQ